MGTTSIAAQDDIVSAVQSENKKRRTGEGLGVQHVALKDDERLDQPVCCLIFLGCSCYERAQYFSTTQVLVSSYYCLLLGVVEVHFTRLGSL